jgi:hypothetical protein
LASGDSTAQTDDLVEHCLADDDLDGCWVDDPLVDQSRKES